MLWTAQSKANVMSEPTRETYEELQQAHDHFNHRLFGGELPPCLLTLQREKQTAGYFSPAQFVNRITGERTDEIALNPTYFVLLSLEKVMEVLAHNMVHQWQCHFGAPGRRRYHNKEWSAKMQAVGLMPSDTGEDGGKTTGEKMSHYAIAGGEFEGACQDLLTANYRLTWLDRFPMKGALREAAAAAAEEGEIGEGAGLEGLEVGELEELGIDTEATDSKPNRVKYSCPSCGANAWGGRKLLLLCGRCEGAPGMGAVDYVPDEDARS